jgi:chromosome partitioning protein
MPSLGITTINALACADSILIPCSAAFLSVKGLEMLLMTISNVREELNPKLQIEGILMTMVDARTNYAKDVSQIIEEAYGDYVKIFDHIIPMSVRAAEMSAEGISIFRHDPKGKVAQAYAGLTEEVLTK